jgi:hypothetical protein
MLPTDIENLTLDQALVLLLPRATLVGKAATTTLTIAEAEREGRIKPQPAKSKAQILREKIAAEKASKPTERQKRIAAREDRKRRRQSDAEPLESRK